MAREPLHLTQRQQQIIALILRGFANKNIAKELGITEQAVKEHVSVLLAKFAVPNRAALVAAVAPRLEVVGDVGVDGSWLRQLFREAEVQMCILRGPALRFEAANKTFMTAVGGRAILGRTMREAFPELEGQGVFELVERVYASGEALVEHERLTTWDTGRTLESRYVDLVLQALRDESGVVNGVLSLAVDVTDQVRANGSKPSRVSNPEPLVFRGHRQDVDRG